MDTDTLLKHRAQKFRKLGGFQEGIPIDPKRKVNMKKKEEPIIPISKTSESELRDEVEKVKQQVMEASKTSTRKSPETGLKEMVEKLKREIDYEYDEAAKALGMEEKLLMLREEVAKGRNLNDQFAQSAMKEKIEQLKSEFAKNLPSSPNYPSLISKIEMMKELSKAFNLSNKGTNKDALRLEINKRFGEFMNRPDVKQKVEALKAEITRSGAPDLDSIPELKQKAIQLNEELDLEFKAILKSLELEVIPSNQEALGKMKAFNEEVHMIIEDVISSSSDLKEKMELLKTEVEKHGNSPNVESKTKITGLIAEIKQAINEAMSIPELKEKHERLTAEILESSNGSLDKEDEEEEESQVKVNQDTNRSLV